jgi:hypothetical protein
MLFYPDHNANVELLSSRYYGILIAKGGVDVALTVGHLEHAF